MLQPKQQVGTVRKRHQPPKENADLSAASAFLAPLNGGGRAASPALSSSSSSSSNAPGYARGYEEADEVDEVEAEAEEALEEEAEAEQDDDDEAALSEAMRMLQHHGESQGY